MSICKKQGAYFLRPVFSWGYFLFLEITTPAAAAIAGIIRRVAAVFGFALLSPVFNAPLPAAEGAAVVVVGAAVVVSVADVVVSGTAVTIIGAAVVVSVGSAAEGVSVIVVSELSPSFSESFPLSPLSGS